MGTVGFQVTLPSQEDTTGPHYHPVSWQKLWDLVAIGILVHYPVWHTMPGKPVGVLIW
jgi:hypothetical protein